MVINLYDMNQKRPKIICFNQVLTDHIVDVASRVGDTVLIYGKGGRVRRNFEGVKRVPLRVTFLGVRAVTRFFFPKNQTHHPRYFIGLGRVLRHEKPDVVVATDIFQPHAWRCIRYARLNGRRLILLSETKKWPGSKFGKIWLRFSLWYIRRNLKYIDKIVVWTEQGRKFYARYMPEANVELIPAPVDTNFFYPAQKKDWLPEGKLRILMNARFVSFKRHNDLLKAVLILREKGLKASVSLIGSKGLGVEDMEKQIAKYGLRDVVHILPPRQFEEMPSLYHEHDVLVLPSYQEAIGMVVPEAMSCGVPTITSDTVGANLYVKEGVTGLIFKTKDVTDLANKLAECFDARKLQVMGKSARQYCVDNFGNEQIEERFDKLFRQISK